MHVPFSKIDLYYLYFTITKDALLRSYLEKIVWSTFNILEFLLDRKTVFVYINYNLDKITSRSNDENRNQISCFIIFISVDRHTII